MKVFDPKEPLMAIDQYIKTARLSMAIMTTNMAGKAIVNELLIDYTDPLKPTVFIKNPDGNIVPIYTKSDLYLEQFLNNFLEVSDTRTKNYEPSIWAMLQKDSSGNTNWTQEVITHHYKFIEANRDDLSPYVMQTFKDNERHVLVPFMLAGNVYYNLDKIISGEDIRDLDDVIAFLYKTCLDIRDNFNVLISDMNTKYLQTDTRLTAENKRQDKDIETLEKNVEITRSKVDDLSDQIGDVKSTTERNIRGQDLYIGGNGNYIYPVKIKYKSDIPGFAIDGGKEAFLGMIILTMNSAGRTITVKLGYHTMTTSPLFYADATDQNYSYTHKHINSSDNRHYVYDIINVGSSEYIVYLRGATMYKVWSKYIENIEIINSQTGDGTIIVPQGTFSWILDTDLTRNPQLTNNNYLGQSTTLYSDNGIHVTTSIMLGTGSSIAGGV